MVIITTTQPLFKKSLPHVLAGLTSDNGRDHSASKTNKSQSLPFTDTKNFDKSTLLIWPKLNNSAPTSIRT